MSPTSGAKARSLGAGLCLVLLAACAGPAGTARPEEPGGGPTAVAEAPESASGAEAPVETLRFAVRATHPHDRRAFTQGLEWHDGALWESTGRHGTSELRRVDLTTGEVTDRAVVGPSYFAEGLTRVGQRWVQLTWRQGTAFVWEMPGLLEVGRFTFDGEGWGLCHDGERFVMSDGTATLTFRATETFEEIGRVTVTEDDRPVASLNELECVDGAVYANVWGREEIVRIDPADGRVTARIDAADLLTPEQRAGTDVLNGIAYRPDTGTWLVTGKWWPLVFEGVFEGVLEPDPGS